MVHPVDSLCHRLFCLSSDYHYSLSFCQHCSCAVSALIFLSIYGVFAKKGNSVHTLRVGVTDSRSGRAPNSWSHQVSSSFWLIILPNKPVLHHAEAVKTQVVFSLLGLCWVVRDTSWKTRLLMHSSLGPCAWLLLSMESLPEKMCEPPRGERSRKSKQEKGRNWMKIDKRPAGITNKMGSQETCSSRVE